MANAKFVLLVVTGIWGDGACLRAVRSSLRTEAPRDADGTLKLRAGRRGRGLVEG